MCWTFNFLARKMLMKSVGWTEIDKNLKIWSIQRRLESAWGYWEWENTLCDCETINRSGNFPFFLSQTKFLTFSFTYSLKSFAGGKDFFSSNLVKLSSPNHSMRDEHNPCEIFHRTFFSSLCAFNLNIFLWI